MKKGPLSIRTLSADAVAIAMLGVIAVVAFRSSYGGGRYLLLGGAFVIVGVAIAAIAVGLRLPVPVSSALALAVYAVVGGALALPHRSGGGILPTPDSIWAALRAIVTGWKELITTSPPVGGAGDLMALPVFSGIVAGYAGYTVARRVPVSVVALVPSAIVMGVGIATGTTKPVSLILHGAVYAATAFAWMAWREHDRRPLIVGSGVRRGQAVSGALMLGLGTAAGLLAAPHLPLASAGNRVIWRQTITPPFDARNYPSPLSAYRRYVKDAVNKDKVMFTVSGLPKGIPLRLATMDAYDGLVWQVSAGDPANPSLHDSGSFERVGAEVPADFEGTVAIVTVTIADYSDIWVPDVGEVVSLSFEGSVGGTERDRQLSEEFRYNRATDTAGSRVSLRTGDRYVMKVRLPTLLDRLEGRVIEPNVDRLGRADGVGALSQALVGPDLLAIDDVGAQLDTLARIMHEGGTYSDGDARLKQVQSRAGHSAYRLAQFVDKYPAKPLIGNAEQYAAAFALVFRESFRVPTRVVMGFFPTEESTSKPIEVRAKDVDAWVEVPVREVGWVAIRPTPDRQQNELQPASETQPEPDYRTQNPPPPPVLEPEFDQSATAAGKAKATKKTETPAPKLAADGSGFFSGAVLVASVAVGVPLALALAVAGLVVLFKVVRRRRRRRRGSSYQRISNGWKEITDLAVDMGRPVPHTITRREAAAFVGGGTLALADRADRAVWAGGSPSDEEVDRYWSDLTAALKSLRRRDGLRIRIKSTVSSQSLRMSRRMRRESRRAARVVRRAERAGTKRAARITAARARLKRGGK